MMRERSVLSVPGSNRRMIEKAAGLPADAVFLDLEDSVAPQEKPAARALVVVALQTLDWRPRHVGFRVNGVHTPYFYRDVIEVVEQAGQEVDFVILPKVERARDVHVLDTLLTQIELATNLPAGKIRVEAQIESTGAVMRLGKIARSTPRLQSLVFGPGDFAAAAGIPVAGIGVADRWDELYPGHRFHAVMAQIVYAARSAGLQAIDGPVADIHNLAAFRRSGELARSLGYVGKWCIHPGQIDTANAVFSPGEEEIARARRIVAAYEEAARQGSGAVSVDGEMVDAATVRTAAQLLAALDQ